MNAFSHCRTPEGESGFSALAAAIRTAALEVCPVEYEALYGIKWPLKNSVHNQLLNIAYEIEDLARKPEDSMGSEAGYSP